MKRIIFFLITLLIILQSCVQDEENIFGIPASERMQQTITEYTALLASSENGWFADYYPEKEHSIGGYAMFLKFNANGTVVVSCETETILPAGEADTSQFEVFAEQGPILSFATYNKVIHYFSEPYASDIDGRAGDYEFVIMKAVSDNEIHLKGKKQGNKLVLRRNVDNLVPKEHFDKITTFSDEEASTFASFYYMIGNDTLATVATASGRTFSLKYKVKHITGKDITIVDTTVIIAYTFTPDGIRLYEPFSLDNIITEKYRDVIVNYFKWNKEQEKYESADPGVNAYLKGYFPPDYQLTYQEFLGEWDMQYHGTSTTAWSYATVTIDMKKNNNTLTLSCDEIFSFAGIELVFDAQKGTIAMLNQNAAVHTDGVNYVRVCAYDREAGYLSTGSTGPIGLDGIWNNEKGAGNAQIHFVDNKRWGTYKPNGILLRLYTISNNTNTGNFTGNIGGYRFNDITLTKQ
ncbi:MAG: DUF4302 domain-containing protein [Prevotellaceae bacterium]|jgi:hypothetical protein|nr:DUF4302 domain-containing protein [Prevotellaceae bacterium]